MQFIAAGENLPLLMRAQRVFHYRIVFISAKNQAERRIISRRPPFLVIIIDVELKLADIFVRQLADVQVDQDVAFQNGMVEDQVDIKMVSIQRDALLTRHDRETSAQLQEKGLQVCDE